MKVPKARLIRDPCPFQAKDFLDEFFAESFIARNFFLLCKFQRPVCAWANRRFFLVFPPLPYGFEILCKTCHCLVACVSQSRYRCVDNVGAVKMLTEARSVEGRVWSLCRNSNRVIIQGPLGFAKRQKPFPCGQHLVCHSGCTGVGHLAIT